MEFKSELDSECAFHVQKTDGFCAPVQIVNKLKTFVASKEYSNAENKHTSALDVLKAKYDCNSETCVLSQYDVKRYVNPDDIDKALKENFKPIGPARSTEWLSNFDIDDVLAQVERKYDDKNFLHIPFQMRDFEKTNSELARLDWQSKYNEGYRTFGTVINTDYSSGKGIHWFCLFGDFLDSSDKFTIEYFNSSGELPLPEISEWMKRTKYSLNFPKEVKDVIVTRIENQSNSHACGVYSLYYIISRLDGVPWEWFKKNKVGDERMKYCRQYLFRDGN